MKAAVLLAAALACLPAAAQTLKPGLWEVQNKSMGNPEMDKAMREMREQMAAMPPEQRKQMEAAMARQGVQAGSAGAAGMSMRMCLTKEMVERDQVPSSQGDCKVTSQQRTGNTLRATFTCSNPPSTGESQVTVQSPEAYTMKVTATSTAAGGKKETMAMEGTGKWLAADCGSVKPVQVPRQ